jgi:hypothetical protein
MRRLIVLGALVLGTVTSSLPGRAEEQEMPRNPILTWNELALDTVRARNLNDAGAARLYAMVNVAMYDAVNGIDRRWTLFPRAQALVPPDGAPRFASRYAAASAAAHAVLTSLQPALAELYQQQLEADLAELGSHPRVAEGQAWGAGVGLQVAAARQNDGSTPTESQTGGTAPGEFRASWSNVQYRNLAPFAIADPSVYVTSGPPPLDSAAYAAALAEVKVIGSSVVPDEEAGEIFSFWVGGANTAQPPGEWIKTALEVTKDRPLRFSLSGTARLFALLGMALSDAVAPTFTTKYVYHFWRPGTAIREADTDGNPHTAPDPNWVPRAGGFGTSPEHISGHSSFAGAATEVLREFFCADNIGFTLNSDSLPGHERTYPSFSAAEAEAGRSRVYGGIHFEFSNQAGLALGRGVASEVLATSLLLTRGPTHFGQCPF